MTSHKEASVLREGSARCSVTAACNISQAVKYAQFHNNLILDLSVPTEAAGVFSFTLDKLVHPKGTLQRLVNALYCCQNPQSGVKVVSHLHIQYKDRSEYSV